MESGPETKLWVICPICYQLNPQGTQFCKHCWGAIIRRSIAIPYDKALAISKQRLFQQKLSKVIKRTVIGLVSLIALAAVVYPGLYNYTDLILKPPQGLNSDSLPGDWAMFRHDLGRSGTIGSISTLPQGSLKWVFPTGAAIHSSPVVVGDTVYIGSRDGKLYALDAETGAKRWEYQTGSWVESSPSVAKGVVYIGSNDGNLYAINARSGEKLWEFPTRYPIMSSPAVADGVLYFGADDHYIYAVDTADGTKLWDFDAGSTVKSSPVVVNGIVHVGSANNFFYTLHGLDGRLRLRFKAYNPIMSSPAMSNGTAYFINSNGYLFAIDSKALTWPQEHEIKPYWFQLYLFGLGIPPPPPQTGLLWVLNLGKTGSSSPVVVEDNLYIGSDNKLIAVDLQSRQKRWEFETQDDIASSPAVAGTTVYIGSKDGRLYAVDAATGEKLWDFLTGDKITSSPAVANGVVYIGSHDGKVYAIK